ncbi:MAG: TRZ/ATZ family hydrolase [Burkholderiaceae bacterium]|nr:TRZ/ATZ family hydrolase [Burkholderiaceae bacterium]
MPTRSTVIAPAWLARVEPGLDVETGMAVVVQGDRIAAIEPVDRARAAHPQAEFIDLPGHLLCPGFVNLHCHAAMSLLRGAGDDLPLERWLGERIWPIEGQLMSPEFVHDGALLGCHELLLGGVTCVNDMYFFPESMLQAARALGMRASAGIVVIDFPSAWGTGPDDYLAKGLAMRDRWLDDPLVGFTLAPHAPYTVGDDALRRVATLSQELGLPVHIHVHETAQEIAQSVEQHGCRPLERLRRLGLLGPDLIAVHAVHLDPAEIALLARHSASVAHCPHSNLKLGSGIAPIAELLDAGVRIGLGTDGAASNNRLDLLHEAHTAAMLAKGASQRAEVFPARAVLEAMTLGGARALGKEDEIGSIRTGKQADLVAVDLHAPESRPVFDPISHLIYTAGREHVADVWIAGHHVVRKRQLAAMNGRTALSDVVGRIGVWQNRISRILSGTAAS